MSTIIMLAETLVPTLVTVLPKGVEGQTPDKFIAATAPPLSRSSSPPLKFTTTLAVTMGGFARYQCSTLASSELATDKAKVKFVPLNVTAFTSSKSRLLKATDTIRKLLPAETVCEKVAPLVFSSITVEVMPLN